ncbi:ABC transporter ATP-binding protein [Lentilactobacillus kosonis]|uniref:ABC transporter, ATP-binding protein n=1 Tax=Lentilactobacillus kosonis TaxID=2810561 RepID=A0A401FIW6_9LACO|nr:ABC transporter ATP-binding protein [Lentilactobacillus kosonis]GAY72315.1 ABC transporter, ATP-binding protein [Lentilactobacillus kosonis]
MNEGIVVTDIDKSFNDKLVLESINLTAKHHQILGLLGPSGSGKTTLVKMIMGMTNPDNGTITVLGNQMPNRKVLQSIGFMAQEDALYDSLSARENLRFFAELFQINSQKVENRINYVASIVNLVPDLNKLVSNFSGGMKRRLSLAISLIADPEILILDEPTVGIDPELRQQIWKELHKYRDEGKAIVITTHVMEDAAQCDQLVMIRDGRIISSGTPIEMERTYHVNNLEEVFLAAGRNNSNENSINH